MRFASTAFIVPVAAALLLTACGGTEPQSTSKDEVAATPSSMQDMATADQSEIQDMTEEMSEDLQERQVAEGGGHATFTAGDQTWQFDSVLCAFGEEEIGQEGAEFVLSALQDGIQLYLSIDSFGHRMSLDDISDFENPSVSLSDDFSAGDFLVVDGKNVRGTSPVLDLGSDTMTTVPGAVEGTCP